MKRLKPHKFWFCVHLATNAAYRNDPNPFYIELYPKTESGWNYLEEKPVYIELQEMIGHELSQRTSCIEFCATVRIRDADPDKHGIQTVKKIITKMKELGFNHMDDGQAARFLETNTYAGGTVISEDSQMFGDVESVHFVRQYSKDVRADIERERSAR